MKLKNLIEEYEIEILKGSTNICINGIEHDSRKISKGNMFVAIEGFTVDGHKYINEAIENGAICVVVQKEIAIGQDVTVVKVDDTKLALAKFSSIFYGEPSKKLNLIGVTGTNGKTSITYLIKSIFEASDKRTGIIGTMGIVIDNDVIDNTNTTPESNLTHKYLKEMVDKGIQFCAMEVSSHSLDLKRVEYMDFKVGIFTNLTEDHLDYHKDMENYYKSKLRLFNMTSGCNIINVDDEYGRRILKDLENSIPVITYGIEKKSDIYATNVVCHPKGVDFILNCPKGSIPINMKLLGKFNVYNVLAAAACAIYYDIDLFSIKKGIESINGIKGRFELVPIEEDYSVIIDFAHTPDGLEKVLSTIKQFAEGRIVVVFGAGGNRDRAKRPIMGETVAKYADLAIVTSDNPRYEDPDKIIEDIIVGIERVNGKYIPITDRKEAIKYALSNARPKDTILLAGKGHETYTIIKDKIIPFDEKQIVLDILKDIKE
ncbi:UDP-N-acetylmuramoylalanyl-D-glutamate--2,6-diaminopimelate ligase [Keratinibaculum paraultunense]|uniref:UDP-N-acetylmuramoyl-L-alanyl-D-glutamate--2,6-diaminopimelate ligase n=1 Tax=Keratinibaculum paraultunense TaxID=1278232 RepID=A0A4R3L107_9FIRM|nr:UDP-N-acetylmuramoyl-L-alanyl-D-glutamate--2,6-diaminopimelate ligase [Keratinibaculum paraultunense]QQY80534.1 UDP-N-acetylmuramoyl-L-alanyl-D-glutamate--2,6-diaminopimelate ligase [Keratinibaculum paraultunense]TCS91257.1 UDP-N-acetylmuramoylalanyl-D-glutamate--2,6-diaminopimelate ligase [Keratinibaculum paraultunense]